MLDVFTQRAALPDPEAPGFADTDVKRALEAISIQFVDAGAPAIDEFCAKHRI